MSTRAIDGVREGYARMVAEQREARRHLLRRLAIDEIVMRTDGGYVEPLMRFFRSRETRTSPPVIVAVAPLRARAAAGPSRAAQPRNRRQAAPQRTCRCRWAIPSSRRRSRSAIRSA